MAKDLGFTFSNPTPLCIGDPYKGENIKRKKPKADNEDDADRTKNIITSPGKLGQTVSTFSSMPFQYPRLFEGEEWVGKGQMLARERLKAKKKQISEVPFKPSSGTKKHGSRGDYVGTFSSPWKNLPTGIYDKIERKRPKEGEDDGPRNGFYTSPSKKGQGADSLLGNNKFTYKMGDTDDHWKEFRKKNRLQHEKAIGDRPAFTSTVYTRNSSCTKSGFDMIYTKGKKSLPDKKEEFSGTAMQRIAAKQMKEEAARGERRAFIPARKKILHSMGYLDREGNIRDYPPYYCEGEKRPGRRKPKIDPKLADRKAFAPSSTPKTGPSAPIFSKGLYKATIHRRR